MRNIVVYDLEIARDDFFIATFINVKTNGRVTCYVLDDIHYETDIINQLIEKCLFVGYNNHLHNDIILNYIFHHNTINTHELYTLSKTIKEGIDVFRHEKISFYIDKYINALDLFKIASIERLSIPSKKEIIGLTSFDEIKSNNIDNTEDIKDLFDNVIKSLNYGFKKSSNHDVTSDSVYKTYLCQLLHLNDNERIINEKEEKWR